MSLKAFCRWRTFSLRSLIVVFTIFIIWIGTWILSAREQGMHLNAIRQQCDFFTVWYDDEFADESKNAYGGTPGVFPSGVTINLRRKSWVPAFVERRLAKDYFHGAISVVFTGARDQDELFRQVAQLESIEQLTPHVSVRDADIKQITTLRRLKKLDLMDPTPELSDRALELLSGLPSLEALSICDAQLTNNGLAAIAKLRRLKELGLGKQSTRSSQFKFSDEGVAQLESLTNLVCLELDCPSLSGEGLKHLVKLTKLKILHLNSSKITDDDLRLLAALPNLETLTLQNATFSGIGFAALSGLSKLEWFNLDGSTITDKAIPFIAQLPALRSLEIDNGNFTAAGLEPLARAPKLTQVQIRSPVPGDLKQLKNALPNRSLYVGNSFL